LAPGPRASQGRELRHIYAFDSKKMGATRAGIFLRVLPECA
jgi:hypothetical protein